MLIAPYTYSSNYMSNGWTIAALVLAIVGGILTLLLFLNKKNKYEGNIKKLYNFLNFDFLTLDIIVKFLYTTSTIFVILNSFNYISQNFLSFVLYLIVGLIVTRVMFEMLMLTIKICKNTTEIKESLVKSDETEEEKATKKKK
jgi:hypothetical protein